MQTVIIKTLVLQLVVFSNHELKLHVLKNWRMGQYIVKLLVTVLLTKVRDRGIHRASADQAFVLSCVWSVEWKQHAVDEWIRLHCTGTLISKCHWIETKSFINYMLLELEGRNSSATDLKKKHKFGSLLSACYSCMMPGVLTTFEVHCKCHSYAKQAATWAIFQKYVFLQMQDREGFYLGHINSKICLLPPSNTTSFKENALFYNLQSLPIVLKLLSHCFSHPTLRLTPNLIPSHYIKS